MRTVVAILILLAGASAPAQPPVPKDGFNLIQINRSFFRLLTLEPTKEEAKKVDGADKSKHALPPTDLTKQKPPAPPAAKTETKIAPAPQPKRAAGEVYTDSNGKARRASGDDQGDFFWDGRQWWRTVLAPQTPCPDGQCPIKGTDQ